MMRVLTGNINLVSVKKGKGRSNGKYSDKWRIRLLDGPGQLLDRFPVSPSPGSKLPFLLTPLTYIPALRAVRDDVKKGGGVGDYGDDAFTRDHAQTPSFQTTDRCVWNP